MQIIMMQIMMIILQQQQGTVNGPPQLESSVVRTNFNMPNTKAVYIIRNGDFNYPVYRLPRVEGQPVSVYWC